MGTPIARLIDEGGDADEAVIDQVFFALADPVRRRILEQLDEEAFGILLAWMTGLLARVGRRERTVLIRRGSLVAGSILPAGFWLYRYSKYWQEQFGMLAIALEEIEEKRSLG